MALGADGSLLVADQCNHCIRRIRLGEDATHAATAAAAAALAAPGGGGRLAAPVRGGTGGGEAGPVGRAMATVSTLAGGGGVEGFADGRGDAARFRYTVPIHRVFRYTVSSYAPIAPPAPRRRLARRRIAPRETAHGDRR